MISCAFTGHRPARFHFKYNEEHPDCIMLKQAMNKEICALIEKDVTTFYSGMALGVDTWGAELVLEHKKCNPNIKLIAVLPCEAQPNRWTEHQRNRYFNLLPQCDEVVYVSQQYTLDCMYKRNRYLVDNSQYLLAVYDGQGKGGTAYTVQYAKKNGKSIIIIPIT